MTRLFPLLLVAAILVASDSCEKPSALGGQAAVEPRSSIGNRTEPTETQLLIIAKSFCVAMRRNHDEKDARALRHFFDPRYLKTHKLAEGPLSIEMAPVGAIYNMQVADDRRTILCIVDTGTKPNGEKQREAILLRVTLHEGKLYLLPLRDPAARSRAITPWILRMKL